MAEHARVERWALARLAQERDWLRLEIVGATEAGNKALLPLLATGESEFWPSTEEYAWWQGGETISREMRIAQFRKLLGLGEEAELAEGMVLYALVRAGRKKPSKVINATPLARELSKAMYNSLLDMAFENAGGA